MYIVEVLQMSPNELKNLPVIATAIQLISEVALNVIGNDVAAEVDGVKVTQSSVKVLASASLNKVLSEKCHA
jgi:hypothetical protein